MKERIYESIKRSAIFGTIFPDSKRLDDYNYFYKDNLFKYRLSKIQFFLGEKNEKEIILGLQAFYQINNGKEIAGEEHRDKTEKEKNIKILEISPNDYICNFHLKSGDDRITQIRLITKTGKEFIVGSDEGEENVVDFINDNKNNVILYFYGVYRKYL